MKQVSRPEYVLDKYFIRITSEVRGRRGLITPIVDLASRVAVKPESIGILVLDVPKMTGARLQKELSVLWKTLNPDVAKRLNIVAIDGQREIELVGEIPAPARKHIQQRINDLRPEVAGRLVKADYYYVIMKILVTQWLRKNGPLTRKWLMETAGCTYPTVSSALHRLREFLSDADGKGVELGSFPEHEWNKLLAGSSRLRSTIRFTDETGRQKNPDELVRRIRDLNRSDIAIGGTFGAEHYHPGIKLSRHPHVDICVHSMEKYADIGFVQEIDPDLKMVEPAGGGGSLVLHFVRRRDSLFERDGKNVAWADPAECLLDLQEAGMETEAQDFVRRASSP